MTFTAAAIVDSYISTRSRTVALCNTLSAEDMVAQSMPDASPAKWHLAHTTWFFEAFILKVHGKAYPIFDESFAHLFNSYYETAGTRHARPQRGLLTRPPLERIWEYRKRVDEAILAMLDDSVLNETTKKVHDLVLIGLHHEMQHQELLLTDILHLFSHNPTFPSIFNLSQTVSEQANKHTLDAAPYHMEKVSANMVRMGAKDQDGFSYDCERPCHDAYLGAYELANRLVTNGEWLAFMHDGGYEQPLLWLSDGWAHCQQMQWQAPLYWFDRDGQWFQYGLDGLQPLALNAPVCHISFYEADAFARWANMRLPREHELEYAAQGLSTIQGNFLDNALWRPQPLASTDSGIQQLYGDVWEWTQSAYLPYPNFKSEQGALGEYNGKFMVNQFVLKGGSCATAQMQMRSSYRNFFHPHQRWQYTGLRLAKDA